MMRSLVVAVIGHLPPYICTPGNPRLPRGYRYGPQSYRLLFRVTVRAVRVGLRARIRGLGSVFGVKVGLSRSTRTTLVLGLEFRVRVRVFPSTTRDWNLLHTNRPIQLQR